MAFLMSIRSIFFSKNTVVILSILFFAISMTFVYWTGEDMKRSGLENRKIQQKIESQLAITAFKKELDKFALLVLGIRNQIESIEHIPDATELQSFLHAQVAGMNFHDSLVISYLDKNHVFHYSVTNNAINVNGLLGESLSTIRDTAEINRLNHLMTVDELLLFPPLNLVEGWVGIPLNFRIQKKGETVGYFAPIIDFKSIIDEVYQQAISKDFVYKFSYNNELVFDRYVVYDGSRTYSDKKDLEFYQNFKELSEEDFFEDSFSRFGTRFYIGVSHKKAFQLSASQSSLLYSWYFVIILFFSVIWTFSYWEKKKKQELEMKNEQLIKYNEALERFTFAASHDLKEPLRNISSFSSLLNRRYKNVLDENGKEYLGFIKRNVSKMYTLLEDLLAYAKLVNSAEVPKESIDFDDIIRDVKESLHTSLAEKNTQLSIADNFPAVYANRLQLHQVVQNLVSNAIKFNNKENPKIQIGFESSEKQHVFFIKDNGIGIDKEFHQKIFNTFQQLNKRDYEGSGIGLAICKKIIEQSDGEIWLESKKGNGSTFYFSLPPAF